MTDLYCGLQALVTSPDWTSQPIPLKTGVYQGNPFSGAIFNAVICTMADSLKSMQHLGYKFPGTQRTIHLLQYVDDTCLISDGPESCKRLLKRSGMKAKVPKCHSLALRASRAKTYDPKLHLYDQPIHFIENQTTRFLGETFQIPFDSKSSRNSLSTKLSTMLRKVDAVPITSHQNYLYRAAVCPRLNWDLMVNKLPMSWVTATLEATTTRFLKKWIGLAEPADPSRLYLPRKKGDLGLPAISTVYQKQQTSVASLILTSSDPIVQHIAHLTIKKEQNLHRPTLEVRDTWYKNTDTNRKAFPKKEKIQVTERESDERLESTHQGQLMCAMKAKQPAHGPLQCSSYHLKY